MPSDDLLEPLLDAWDRNNRILVNLLEALPPGSLDARAMMSSPSVAQLFTHIHYVRLVFIAEDIPDFAVDVPEGEWLGEQDVPKMAAMLNESARIVRQAVESRVRDRKPTDVHFDHPILLLQHMIWHEGYHHGQIKLTLKLAGHALPNDRIGKLTWGVWMRKTDSV